MQIKMKIKFDKKMNWFYIRAQYNIQPVTYGTHIRSKSNIIDADSLKLVDLPLDYIREMDVNTGIIKDEYFSDYINRVKTILLIVIKQKKCLE